MTRYAAVAGIAFIVRALTGSPQASVYAAATVLLFGAILAGGCRTLQPHRLVLALQSPGI
jgi:hypothetical protein